MQPPLELVGVEIENLRGFERTSLDLDRPVTLLVGPNNSGKTSVLRILDWAFNGDMREFEGHPVAPEVVELLQPARNTRAKARRLTLLVWVEDGRRHKRFKCERGIARLRVGLRLSPEPSLRVNLGWPTRSEGGRRDADAHALFEELRELTTFRLIPATRDASSPSFSESLDRAITRRLEPGAVNVGRGRAPAGYRTVDEALKSLRTVAEELVEPIWEEMKDGLPAGMARTGTIKVDAEPADLVTWIASVLRLRLSTGDHDENSVRPTEVGSGLQSLLELGLAQTEMSDLDQASAITVLEEPEAFLHPAAQRTLARDLFLEVAGKRVVSTHSPILVEEAGYEDVVLVHGRQFHHPVDEEDEERCRINTAFLTRYGAEMVFAKGVLLVEGESDRELFEKLRRRLAPFDESGRIDGLMAIPTGSKDRFGPWLRLIRSYRTGSDIALGWLALVDGDAATAISAGFKAAGVGLDQEVRAALGVLAESPSQEDLDAHAAAARRVNALARTRAPLAISPGDLEWACLHSVSDATSFELGEAMGIECDDGAGLARALGSKHCESPVEGKKEPWRRALIGQELPLDELTDDTRDVLARWMGLVMPAVDAKAVLATAARSG